MFHSSKPVFNRLEVGERAAESNLHHIRWHELELGTVQRARYVYGSGDGEISSNDRRLRMTELWELAVHERRGMGNAKVFAQFT